MLVLLAHTRGNVRRDRLERAASVLAMNAPFASLGAERRATLIHEQSIIVEFERDRSVEALPTLLSDPEERRNAVEVVEFIAGAVEEMEPHTLEVLQRFHSVLDLPSILAMIIGDPRSTAPKAKVGTEAA
jgi:hypothetical protein